MDVLIEPELYDDIETITVEIRPGAGGLEAAMFTDEILNMYINFFSSQGWSYNIINY